MPPKKDGKAKKSKKSAKPEWMADDVWAVKQDLPALLNSFAGVKSDKPSKSDKGGKSDKPATPGKAGKAAKPEPLPTIPKAQAGLFLWQQLLPKKAAAPREELLKLDIAGATAKCIASGVVGDMTPAAGVLSCIAAHSDAARELVFAARPAVLPHLLNALSLGSPSLTASAIGALRVLATAEDSRPRVIRATKEWDWRPLVSVLEHEDDLPQCGTNLAATDAVLTVQALLATQPPPDAVITAASKAAAAAVVSRFLEAAGLPALLKVCRGRHSSPAALASAAHTLLFLLYQLPDRTLPDFAAGGGVLAAAAVVRDTRVTLKGRACAAGCLKLYMARTPQELIAAGVTTSSSTAAAEAVPGSAPGTGPLGAAQGTVGPSPSPRVVQDAAGVLLQGSVQPALVPAVSSPGASNTGLSITSPAPAPQPKAKPPMGRAKKAAPVEPVSFALGWFADSGKNDGEERLWLEEQMLVADGVKEKVLARVHEVAHSRVIPLLVELCNGPAGPLAAIDLNSPAPPADDKKKKKGKGAKANKKGKKAGKLEDGMAEAQVQAAGCLRLLSLSDLVKVDIMAAGAVRFLTPLLESKLHHARWNARQALFNLAMLPEHVSIMTRYKVPNYIHMGNMPASHLRPMTAPPVLGHRMAKLGLTGAAPARAVATAPAGLAANGLGNVESPRIRRGSNTNPGKLGSSAVFPSFTGMATGGSPAFPTTSSLSQSDGVVVPASFEAGAGSNAAMHASFERPMTAAAASSGILAGTSLGMTASSSLAGSSVGMAAGMAGMFGQPLARPSTAAVQPASQSGGL